MPIIPKIEQVAKDATITHFLLMFGYKLFSLYFPLFLVVRGFSLPEVGYTYLFIYLPLALFSPVVGFLNHKVNPAILATLGILGYAVYALGLIMVSNPILFYMLQAVLGLSAALFFVSARAILMGYPLEKPDRSFGWFYSSTFYADAIAPAVGALLLWKFNFIGVFVASLVICFITAVFCFSRLRKPAEVLLDQGFTLENSKENYKKAFQVITGKSVLPFILLAFSALLFIGFFRPYFILFLKDNLLWSQNMILLFVSVFSFVFFPISLLVIRYLGRSKSEKNLFQGSLTAGVFSIIFGLAIPFLSFLSILVINLGRSVGNLICSSSRSGLISRKLKDIPEEAGAIDTIFAPLGLALGALAAGLLVGFLGYSYLFILGGLFVTLVSLSVWLFAKIKRIM